MQKKINKKIVLYLNILASMAWVTRRITHHIIFFLHVHFLDVQFVRQLR
jgi:hypothetical protein